ncbi:MAG: Clp protease N-terminal domain-containing protein, partial [Rickettsiales bacterium]
MDLEKMTDKTRTVLQTAQALALRSSHQRFTPEHLLAALAQETTARKLLEAAGGNAEAISKRAQAELKKMPKVEGSGAGQLYMPPETAKLMDAAQQLASKAGDEFLTVERLLQALALAVDAPAGKILKEEGVTSAKLNDAVNDMRKGRTADSPQAEDQFEALKKYTKDLTELAQNGKLDPVIGRDEESRRTIQVLSRRTKNNPVL